MDFGRFNQAEQAEINAIIEQKTVSNKKTIFFADMMNVFCWHLFFLKKKKMSEFLKQFTNTVDVCFKRCAQDFQTKAVTRREVIICTYIILIK